MKEIVVDIAPDGKIKMEGNGFVGKECDVVMAEIETALGEVERKQLKPEHSITRTTTNKVTR
jgi:hypothetical protein